MPFENFFRHVLPKNHDGSGTEAWRLEVGRTITNLFDGLTESPSEVKNHLDDVYLDLLPQSTRALQEWVDIFGLWPADRTDQQARDAISSAWSAVGGQGPDYLQSVLRDAGFDVYVHDYYDSVSTVWNVDINGVTYNYPITGEDITAANYPFIKNPLLTIEDGYTPTVYSYQCGVAGIQCGVAAVKCGATIQKNGYLLVNKIPIGSVSGAVYQCGMAGIQCGVPTVQCGVGAEPRFLYQEYQVPTNALLWNGMVYIGGQTYPEVATVEASRREEFEALILKYFPAEKWFGVLVEYI